MSSTTVRAKFRCTQEVATRWGGTADPSRAYNFDAVYEADKPEDQRYAKATPVGKLTMTVDNPAVVFEPGRSYFLDISPAD